MHKPLPKLSCTCNKQVTQKPEKKDDNNGCKHHQFCLLFCLLLRNSGFILTGISCYHTVCVRLKEKSSFASWIADNRVAVELTHLYKTTSPLEPMLLHRSYRVAWNSVFDNVGDKEEVDGEDWISTSPFFKWRRAKVLLQRCCPSPLRSVPALQCGACLVYIQKSFNIKTATRFSRFL